MGLKNKLSRTTYLLDIYSWDKVGEMCNDTIKVFKLKEYPIAKLTWTIDLGGKNFFSEPNLSNAVIGIYEINPDYTLKSVYSMSVNQCVDLMTQIDKENK